MKEFDAYHACCNANYQWLWRLLPSQYETGDSFLWQLKHGTLSIYVVEKKAYTDNLVYQQDLFQNLPWLKNFTLYLKRYHDSRSSEVVGFQNNQGIRCRLTHVQSIPHKHSHEKWQMNRLLYETLALCFSLRSK